VGLSSDPQKAARQLAALAQNNPSLAARLRTADRREGRAIPAGAGQRADAPGARPARPAGEEPRDASRSHDRRLDYSGFTSDARWQETGTSEGEVAEDVPGARAEGVRSASRPGGPLASFWQGLAASFRSY
jgi:hypothetical protein